MDAPRSPNTPKNELTGLTAQLESFFEEYLVKKAPFQLPMNAKEILVKIAPYLVIIMLIITLPILIAALGLNAALAPFLALGGGYYAGWGTMVIVSGIFALLTIVCEIIALPGLFRRTRKGWLFTFYAQLISFVGSLIGSGFHGLLGTLLGTLIGLYLLFQVKDMYK